MWERSISSACFRDQTKTFRLGNRARQAFGKGPSNNTLLPHGARASAFKEGVLERTNARRKVKDRGCADPEKHDPERGKQPIRTHLRFTRNRDAPCHTESRHPVRETCKDHSGKEDAGRTE